MLASSLFQRAAQLSRFLRFTVEKSLAGETAEIKEFVIGIEVYRRPPSYDPRMDSCVRVGVGKLRDKLGTYYRTEGADDPVVIDLPKGTYIPVFRLRGAEPEIRASRGGNGDSYLNGDPSEPADGSVRVAAPAATGFRLVHWMIVAGLAVAVVGGAIAYALHLRSRSPHPPPVSTQVSSIALRRSVAMLGFANLSGRTDVDWLADALAGMVATEVGASGELRIVAERDVARATPDLLHGGQAGLSKETLTHLHRLLGADYVVTGSYTALGEESDGQLRLDLRLQDATTGEMVAVRSEIGTGDRLSNLATRAGLDVRMALGERVSPTEEAQAAGLLPSNPQAARFYAAGLRELHQENGVVARDLLKQVVDIEPSFPMGHLQLSAAWALLGYDLKARAEAKRAFDLSQPLDPRTRLLIEANYREAAGDREKTKGIRRALYSAFPDDLDNGIELAWDLINTGSAQEALITLEQLRGLPPPLRDDPGLDQAEAFARASLSDYERARAACLRGEEKARALGLPLLGARLRSLEGGILADMGKGEEATRVSLEARAVCDERGDRACTMAIDRRLGNMNVISEHPNGAEAVKYYEKALRTARELDNQEETNFDLIGLATAYWGMGQFRDARTTYEDLLVSTRKQGPPGGILANVELNYGGMLVLQGDLPPAMKMLNEAVAISRKRDEKGALAGDLQNLAEAERRAGDLAGAARDYGEAIDLYREFEPRYAPDAQVGLADVLLDRGDLEAALSMLKKTEADAQSAPAIDVAATTAECRVRLTRAAFAQGDFAGAGAAREGLTGLAGKHPEEAIEAGALLVEVLSAQGKGQEALTALAQAQRVLAKMPYTYYHLELTIAGAGIKSAASDRPGALPASQAASNTGRSPSGEAIRNLLDAIAQAHSLGLVGVEFQARLMLGKIEMESGSAAVGRAHLLALTSEARAKGFALIAHQAEQGLLAETRSPKRGSNSLTRSGAGDRSLISAYH
jgi:tetratricopeptide (TPR) repeat protein/TolB-like protein